MISEENKLSYGWRDGYLLEKPGVRKDYVPAWEATRYLVGDKMFAMEGRYKDRRPILTLRCAPEFGELLRAQYEDVIPGYYMNKVHWNSVFLDGENIPSDEILKEMIDCSYQIIFGALTKKKQHEINAFESL